jgi:hypothetical protein
MPDGRWFVLAALLLLSACQPPVPPATPPSPTTAPAINAPAPKPTVLTPPPPTAASTPTSASTPPAVGVGRVDVLNSANAAFASGKTEEAAGLYERVINTPPTAGESAAATVAIEDFAHFRAMVALLAAGNEDDARTHFEALRGREPSAPLPRLADQFWNQYSMTASVKAACAQLQPQVASQAGPVLSTLQSLGVSIDSTSFCGVG